MYELRNVHITGSMQSEAYLKLIHSAAQAKVFKNAKQKFSPLICTVDICTVRVRIQ